MSPVHTFQELLTKLGLTPGKIDGDFGPKTAFAYQGALLGGLILPDDKNVLAAKEVAAKRSPRRRDLARQFGPPPGSWVEGQGGRVVMAEESTWKRNNIRRYVLATGHTVWLHKRVAGQFIAAFAEVELELRRQGATGEPTWRPSSVQSFVLRHKMWSPEKDLSEHARGIALDIDPDDNGYGKKGDIAKKHSWLPPILLGWGISWGGSWRGSRDDMHFEAVTR